MPAFKKVSKGVQVTKCTPEVIKIIVNQLRLGHYVETAVIMAGVSKKTYYEWLKNSHDKSKRGYKKIFAELRNAVEKAQAEAETRDLQNIDRCAMGQDAELLTYPEGTIHPETGEDVSGQVVFINNKPQFKTRGSPADWSASAWRLERRNPKKWANTEKTIEVEDHGDDEGSKVRVEFVDADNEKK